VEALPDLESRISGLKAIASIFATKLLRRAHAPSKEVATETCKETSAGEAAEVLTSKAKAIEHAISALSCSSEAPHDSSVDSAANANAVSVKMLRQHHNTIKDTMRLMTSRPGHFSLQQ